MLIELLLILLQFRHVLSHEFIDRIAILMLDELVLDILERDLSDGLEERMVLIKVDLLHGLLIVINNRSIRVINPIRK